MDENNVKTNSLKAWILAARPKTLTAAAVPVMVATALAWTQVRGEIDITAAVLCFLFAFVMQIDANFVNDYFDCVRGNDDETRLGPLRACAQGWITLPAMRIALVLTTLLGCAVGLPLAFIGGWEMVLVGIACVVFCFLYTTTLSYLGLGDLLVLVFFGIVPVCCTYYVETGGAMNWYVGLISLCVGMVIDTLLIINNYRDIDNDRRAGKRTLAVLMGKGAMEWTYLIIVPAATLMQLWAIDMLCPNHSSPFWVGIATFIIIFNPHFTTYHKMKLISHGKELNKVLGMTARNIFIYGVASTILIVLAMF